MKPVAQVSFNQTGLIVQGNTAAEEAVNTNDSWLCSHNGSYKPHQARVYGYYAAGPGEQVDAAAYPWGWETPGFDDSAWNKAQAGMTGGAKGARDYPGRLLVPTPIPPMENRTERFAEVRRSDGVRIPEGFPGRAATVTVPAHTTAEILLDNDSLTTAYLSLLFSGGKGSQITVAYAEALYRDTQTFFKDDRNEVKNKQFLGYEDIVRPDGGNGRLYTTLWWRTWRYVKLTVTTQDDPLELQRHLRDIHRLSVRKGIVVRGAGTRETVADAGYRLAHRPAVRQRNLHGLSLLRATAIFRRHADPSDDLAV